MENKRSRGITAQMLLRRNEIACKLVDDVLTMCLRKNADYGNSFIRTWREMGPISAITRIADKVHRLESLATRKGEPNYESIEDTLMDLMNYCVMYDAAVKWFTDRPITASPTPDEWISLLRGIYIHHLGFCFRDTLSTITRGDVIVDAHTEDTVRSAYNIVRYFERVITEAHSAVKTRANLTNSVTFTFEHKAMGKRLATICLARLAAIRDEQGGRL